MNAPSAEVLLRVWEEHDSAHPIRRALALLDAAWPEIGIDAWARSPIGTRDAWLLTLYARLFGADLQTVTRCPQCGDRLESTFGASDIVSEPPAMPASEQPLKLRAHDYDIEYRLPHSVDLLHVIDQPSKSGSVITQSLRRCVLEARHGETAVAVEQLPAPVVERLVEEMEKHDPNAEIRIGLSCPACGHGWNAVFDIVAYLWSELDDWAQRLLAEIHALASAYGWREADILALSPTRRQRYLDMVRA